MPDPESDRDKWSSPLSDWYNRTTPHPSPKDADLSRSNLLFGVGFNAQSGSGFTAAFFNPDIAVTACGHVLILSLKDAEGFNKLTAILRADFSGDKLHFLSLPSEVSCRPNTLLHIPICESSTDETNYESEMHELSVNNYHKWGPKFAKKHGLPLAAWELLGLVEEMPSAWSPGGDEGKDEEVLGRLKGIKELNVVGGH